MDNTVNINLLSEILNKIKDGLTDSHLVMDSDKRIELNTNITSLLDQALKADRSIVESLELDKLDGQVRNYINSDPYTLEELNEVLNLLNKKIEVLKSEALSKEQEIKKYNVRITSYKDLLKKYGKSLKSYKEGKVLFSTVKAKYLTCLKEYNEIMADHSRLNTETLEKPEEPQRVHRRAQELTSNDLKALIEDLNAYNTALGDYETTSAVIYKEQTENYQNGKITYEQYMDSVSEIITFYFGLKETQKELSKEVEEVTSSYSDDEKYNLATDEEIKAFQNELREYEKNLAIYARESKVLEEYRKEFEEGKMSEEEFHVAEEVLSELENKLTETRKGLMQRRKKIYNPSILPRKMKFKKLLEARLTDPNLTEESRKECEAKLTEITREIKEIKEFKSKIVIKQIKKGQVSKIPIKQDEDKTSKKKPVSDSFDLSKPVSFGYLGPKSPPDPKPDPTPVSVPPTLKESDELLKLYYALLEKYKKDYEGYIQDHDKLEALAQAYNNGEIPYDEYEKFADKFIYKENVLKGQYSIVMQFYDYVISREKNLELEKPQEPLITDKIPRKEFAENKIVIKFKNCGFPIDGYDNIIVEPGQRIHGPVIDPVPLNKKGDPKKINAKVFDHWEDENGNVIEFPQEVTHSMELSAVYKFDVKKALAVGAGVAVGAVAYLVDSAIPLQMPVVSSLGAAGLGIAAGQYGKRLTNITQANQAAAAKITAVDEIPDELKIKIEEAKKKGYQKTFLKTAATACTIASLAHLGKNMIGKVKASQIPQPSPTSNPTPKPQTVDVLGGYEPTGKVFGTAKDAVAGTNGLNPFKPAFAGQETFEAYFQGNRVIVQQGQSIDSIVKAVGATDPSQVAINVMNSDGVPLTWQPLTDMVEQVAQVAPKIH